MRGVDLIRWNIGSFTRICAQNTVEKHALYSADTKEDTNFQIRITTQQGAPGALVPTLGSASAREGVVWGY